LDSQYLFQLDVHERRTGEAWAESLGLLRDRQGLAPKRVVKDAGTGLALGVQLCWPGLEERDDLFHAVYMMGKEAYHLERRAYAAIDKEEEVLSARRKAKNKTETERRRIGQQLRKAREHAARAIDRYDTFEMARQEARRVLDLADPGSGRLRTSAEVVEVLTRVGDQMKALGGRASKVGRYLCNRAPGLGPSTGWESGSGRSRPKPVEKRSSQPCYVPIRPASMPTVAAQTSSAASRRGRCTPPR